MAASSTPSGLPSVDVCSERDRARRRSLPAAIWYSLAHLRATLAQIGVIQHRQAACSPERTPQKRRQEAHLASGSGPPRTSISRGGSSLRRRESVDLCAYARFRGGEDAGIVAVAPPNKLPLRNAPAQLLLNVALSPSVSSGCALRHAA